MCNGSVGKGQADINHINSKHEQICLAGVVTGCSWVIDCLVSMNWLTHPECYITVNHSICVDWKITHTTILLKVDWPQLPSCLNLIPLKPQVQRPTCLPTCRCMLERLCILRSIKPFVAPEKAACNLIIPSCDVTQWLSYRVGNIGTRSWQSSLLVYFARLQYRCIYYGQFNNKWSKISPLFIPCTFLAFQNLMPKFPTMQFSHWITSLEAVIFFYINCSDLNNM